MEQLIVTIIDQKTNRQYDVEVPSDVILSQLLDDITQAISGYDPDVGWILARIGMYSPRLKKMLDKEKTLREEGIWNGDYLQIVSLI